MSGNSSILMVGVESPQGGGNLCELQLNHFCEPLLVGEGSSLAGSALSAYQPYFTIAIILAFVCIVIAAVVIVRKKRS